MRLLHISSYGDRVPCGIADYTQDLIQSLNGADIIQEVFILPVSSYTNEKIFDRLYLEMIEKSKAFDVVHIQHQFGFFRSGKTYIQTLIDFFKLLRDLKSKKVFVTFHTEPLFYRNSIKRKNTKFKRFLYRLKLRYQWKVLLALCKKMAEKEKDKYHFIAHNGLTENSLSSLGFPRECIHNIFLPVKIIKNKETSDYFKKILKKFKKENDILIGIMGFLEVHKGILELLEALSNLPKNYKLVLCGGQRLGHESEFLESVRKKICNTPLLKDRVLITGYIEEVHVHYCLDFIDIFAYPYHNFFASSSAAIGFACQAQKPIIASRIKCFEEIANAYKCFVLVNSHTTYELAAAIERVMDDKQKANELVNNVQKFVAENHWEVAGEKFSKYYQGIH